MKKACLLLMFLFSSLLFAQKTEKEDVRSIKITQKKCVKKKGYQFVLKEVVSDSRCPQGVDCIWAGEIKVVVSLYQNRKFVQDETITVSAKYKEENVDWFSKYLAADQKKIRSIGVFPYPKEGVKINPKDYYLKIEYLK